MAKQNSSVTRAEGYPKGTAGLVGGIWISKWDDNLWSALASRTAERVWAKTALTAIRLAKAA